jgi:TonB-dependent starch-binding outer membrane protein SusC
MRDSFISKSRKAFYLLLIGLVIPWVASAQQKVTGKTVEKKTGNVLAGVVITEKGTTGGTTSGEDGNFSLELKTANPVLLVSFVGHLPLEINVKNRSSIDIYLEEDPKGLSDVVVIGYQNIERRKATGAIATVKGKEFENTPYPTFDAMLQGRVAGLTVLSVSGEPGANNIVNIRGSSSVNPNVASAPLYVIDGIVFDLNDSRATYGNSNPLAAINPNDIESIDVLKDASAAAIYGARAANGVIIVKTKKPKGGKPQIRVGSYFGISAKPAMKPIIVGAAERRMKMDLLRTQGTYERNLLLSQFLTDSLNPAFNNNTDWQGLFLQSAMISNVDANISAATETFSYRLSFNRYTEEGVMIGYDFQRITPRFFLSAKPTKNLEITTDLFMGFVKSTHGSGDGSKYPFNTWGFPSSFWQSTEIDKQIYTGRYDKLRDDDRQTNFNGNTRIMYNLSKSLLFTSSLSYNVGMSRRDYLRPAIINNGRSDAINQVRQNRRWEIENYVTYSKTLNDAHNITALVGQGAEEAVNQGTDARGNGITIDAIKTIAGVPAGPNLTASSYVEERSRLSYFARVGYDYKDKYLIQLNYRRDGSSRYGKDNRWGSFPSVSLGWAISEEAFFEPLANVVPFLKFRGSYGVTGQDPGGYYAQYLTLTTNASYLGSSLGAGATGNITTYNGVTAVTPNYGTMEGPQSAASRNITWETSPQYNVGIDANLLKDRVTVAFDWYVRDSKSKVFSVALPVTSGFSQINNNYVDLRNTGFEININTTNLNPRGAFQWRTNFNFANNKNYVTRLPQGGRDFLFGPPWLQRSLTVGQPLFNFKVWDVDGVYSRIEDVPVDPLTGDRMRWACRTCPMFQAGDPARRDLNGDYIIDDLDKINAGNPYPKIVGGITNSFSYKSFTLDVLATFIKGRNLWNGFLSDKLQDAVGDVYQNWGRVSGPASNFGGITFWQKPGDDAEYPKLINNEVDKWHIAQSTLVEDASFFRVKNIRLGYSLPSTLTNRFKIRSVRLFGMLDNVLVISNATVPDPEAVQTDGYSSGNDYPIPKKWTFGLDINF